MQLRIAKVVILLTSKRRWLQLSLLTTALVVAFGVWLGNSGDPISKLRRQLHDRNERVRERAAMRLGQMGSKARAAESSLVGAIEDQSDSVRGTAALAISAIDGDWRVLVPLLDHKKYAVPQSAAKGIVRSGGDSRLVVRKLLDEPPNPSGARYGSLGTILPSFGPDPTLAAIPVLIDAVAGDDPPSKQTANELLRECLPVPSLSAVPLLTEYLAHPSADARIAAAEQLLRLGNDARQAAGELRRRLGDPDRRVALAMAAALGAVDSADNEFLAVLVEALHAGDLELIENQELCDRALIYCAELGPRAEGVVGELLTLFDDDPAEEWYDFVVYLEWNTLRMSTWLLPQRIGPASLPLLRRILSNGSPHAQLGAAVQLVNLGPSVRCQAPELVPVLTSLLDDLIVEGERAEAIRALGEIGKDAAPAVPRLVKLIPSNTSSNGHIQFHAIEALRKIGVLDETTRAELTTALGGNSLADRRLAAQVLAAGGVPAEAILPTFVESARRRAVGRPAAPSADVDLPTFVELTQDDPQTAADLLTFIGVWRLGPAAAPAMDFLVAQLTTPWTTDDEREFPDEAAAAILGQIGPPAVGRLIEVLDHLRSRTRALAVKALSEIGPAAHAAVPRLIDLLDDRAVPLGHWRGLPINGAAWLPRDWLDGARMPDPFTWRQPLEHEDIRAIDVRDLAIIALGKIGPDSRSAAPRLARMLEEPLDEETAHDETLDQYGQLLEKPLGYGHHRSLAAWTLGRIGPDASSAVPALIRLTQQVQERLEVRAAGVLGRIDPENPALVECLKWYLAAGERRAFFDYDDAILGDILDDIRELGLPAEPLVPDLRRLLDSPLLDLDNRCRAAYALASFPAARPAAVRYLERVAAHGTWSEADTFLEEIKASDHQVR